MVGIAIIPLMGAVGAAVDYTQANATRTAFQNALDATALLLSKTAALQTKDELQAAATSNFNALFASPIAKNATVTAVYSPDNGSRLTLNGSATIDTNFLSVLGIDKINIAAQTTSTWGNTRLRVALVLDNTGSMASSDKMTALKTASHNLLTQLQSAAVKPEDVYVSIVPFNKDVNVDTSNVSAPWLRWDLWEAVNGKCSDTSYKTQSSCLSHSKVWTPAAHSTWNGCVTDRDQNFDTTNDAPVAGSTLYPTEQYGSCPVSLMGLTNDWTTLSNKIDAMQPVGNTNQAIGLADGLAVADGRALHHSRPRLELQVSAGHHSAERRVEYPGSLVHHRVVDRRADNRKPATTSKLPASRSIRCRSTPATIRPRRCYKAAPATRASSSC